MNKYNLGELSFKKGNTIYTLDLDSIKRQFEAFLNGDNSVFARKDVQNTSIEELKDYCCQKWNVQRFQVKIDNDGNISSATYGSNSIKAENNFKIDSEYLERTDIKEDCSDNEIATVGQIRKLDSDITETNKNVETLLNSAKFVDSIPESLEKNSIYVTISK